MVLGRAVARQADGVPDSDVGQPAQDGDLAGRDRRPPVDPAPVEHADRGHLLLGVGTDAEAIPDADGAREHAHVGQLLAGGGALDLEDDPGGRGVGIDFGGRQELRQGGVPIRE